jgi:hypothetical protein
MLRRRTAAHWHDKQTAYMTECGESKKKSKALTAKLHNSMKSKNGIKAFRIFSMFLPPRTPIHRLCR